jgi:hypothetical protein
MNPAKLLSAAQTEETTHTKPREGLASFDGTNVS